MYVREGQIWAGFVGPFKEYKCVTVLEVKVTPESTCGIIGYTDDEEIYFLPDYIFENKFEYKA